MAEAPPRSPTLPRAPALHFGEGRRLAICQIRRGTLLSPPSALRPPPSSLPRVPPGFSHLPPSETSSSPHRPVQWLSFSRGRQKSLPQIKPRKTGWGEPEGHCGPTSLQDLEDGYSGRWQILIAWTPSARPVRTLCSGVNAFCTHQAPQSSWCQPPVGG